MPLEPREEHRRMLACGNVNDGGRGGNGQTEKSAVARKECVLKGKHKN